MGRARIAHQLISVILTCFGADVLDRAPLAVEAPNRGAFCHPYGGGREVWCPTKKMCPPWSNTLAPPLVSSAGSVRSLSTTPVLIADHSGTNFGVFSSNSFFPSFLSSFPPDFWDSFWPSLPASSALVSLIDSFLSAVGAHAYWTYSWCACLLDIQYWLIQTPYI